jgi:PleD family two-component response regulator
MRTDGRCAPLNVRSSDDFLQDSAMRALGNKGIDANKEITMILIADDDSDFAENCSMVLESHGNPPAKRACLEVEFST